jgi:hypothetical protein
MSSKRLRLITLFGVVMITAVIAAGIILTYAGHEERVVPLPSSALEPSGAGGIKETPQGLTLVEITVDNVRQVIDTLNRSDGYTRSVTVENFYATETGAAAAVYTVDVYAYGGALSQKIKKDDEVKNIVIAGDWMYIWYNNDKDYRQVPVQPAVGSAGSGAGSAGDSGNVNAVGDEYQMLLTYEDVLQLDKESILDAGYVTNDNEVCIYVRYVSGSLGYTTVCYISTASGLLTSAEQYDGETLVYRMTTASYTEGVQDLAVFKLPNGKNVISTMIEQ